MILRPLMVVAGDHANNDMAGDPVPVLGAEFDLALIGTKGKWYNHKASVSNPVPSEDDMQEKGRIVWKKVHIAWKLPLKAEAEKRRSYRL